MPVHKKIARIFTTPAKKIIKAIKKPISKITKSIAKGIARVGKSVMRGVSRITKKLGPMGMIALAVAMPYALSGLSGMIGQAGAMHPMYGMSKATGWLGSDNVFLKAIGTVGNNIRTGFTASTGKFAKGWKSITNSISEGFSNFSKGTGNIWKDISSGAKNLFNQARTTMKKFTPKFRAGQSGTVGVEGWGNPFGYADTATMTSQQAAGLIDAGTIQGSQLSGQTFGSPEGWFTKAGSSEADKIISQTINNAMQPRIDMLQGNTKKYFYDTWNDQVAKGINVNKQETFNSIISNKGTTLPTDFSTAYETNLANTGDYGYHAATKTYNFTGGSTYNNQLGSKYITKKGSSVASKIKKAAFGMADSLLTAPNYEIPEPVYEVGPQKDMTMNTQTGDYTGTDLKGAYGTNYFNAVFGNAAWEKLKNNYKYMNI